jgi:hypothetical protein
VNDKVKMRLEMYLRSIEGLRTHMDGCAHTAIGLEPDANEGIWARNVADQQPLARVQAAIERELEGG